MTLYVDLDGVISDFDAGCLAAGVNNKETYLWYTHPRETWTAEQLAVDQQVRNVMLTPGFWLELPFCEGAQELWDFCVSYKPVILTAYPSYLSNDDRDRIIQEKTEWVETKLNTNRIICCERAEKQRLAVTKGRNFERTQNILLDDIPRNISEWQEAGGIAFQHISVEQSINDLKMVL